MDVAKRHAVVVGLGRSGVAAARLLLAKGARVTAVDAAPADKLSAEARSLSAAGASLVLGPGYERAVADADFVIVSPGVPVFSELENVERSGREVIGELELASRFVTAPIALVGGTNGKSTTTALVGAMLEAAGKKTFVGGNFGTPLAEVVDQTFDVLVVEISSFQAERVPTLHARAHALLNITDDHLDRYPSFDAYADAKGNPFVHMTTEDAAVIPYDDGLCAKQAARGGAHVVTFGSGRVQPGADIVFDGPHPVAGTWLVHRPAGIVVKRELLCLPGSHNSMNACAAMGVAVPFGVGQEAVASALASFKGLDHRTVLVAKVGGVAYYDDSKGTNVGASVTAIRGLAEAQVVLIAGGRDKLGAYEPLVDALRDKGRALVVLGEAADRIAAAAAGVLPIERATSMEHAVSLARELARPGDAVLLSPACSSFDMFRDYKDRGDVFTRAARALAGAEGGRR